MTILISIKDNKYNFVDENNVLVGYDEQQDCCEHARWWLTYDVNLPEVEGVDDAKAQEMVRDYHFDPDYKSCEDLSVDCDDSGTSTVVFRLLPAKPAWPPIYLVLANTHNGYYSHGFSVAVGGKTVWDGSL